MSLDILVPYDSSPASDAALLWARDLARALHGSVTLFHALQIVPQGVVPDYIVPPVPTPGEFDRATEDLRNVATRYGLDASAAEVVIAPDAAKAIIDVANRRGVGLIAMGTHGRGALARVVLGGVAHYVIRHAHCPAVTMRAESGARASTDAAGHESESAVRGAAGASSSHR